MEKKYRATGFCPKASKDIEVSVTLYLQYQLLGKRYK